MPVGILYIIATPIGNLGDISERAICILKSVDCVLCEDTRVTKKLLARFDIRANTISYHQHSSLKKVDVIIGMLKSGSSLALVSDAGTPGISDPGGKLVAEVSNQLPDVQIIPIPGACALISALSISGFWADSFVFLGFPPHKKGRETWFKNLQNYSPVVIFYESVHRIKKTLEKLMEICPFRRIVVARELTKKFETIYRGTAKDVLSAMLGKEIKGEFTIVLDVIARRRKPTKQSQNLTRDCRGREYAPSQ